MNNGRKRGPKLKLCYLLFSLFLASLVLKNPPKYEIESNSYFPLDNSKDIDCSSNEWLTFYYIRLKQATPGTLIAMGGLNTGYSGQMSVKSFLPIEGTSEFKYGLYTREGSTCYVHKDPNGKNVYPLFILVIQQSATAPGTCKVAAIITNKDLEVCAGHTKDNLSNILDPSGGASTYTSFTKLTYSSAHKYGNIDAFVYRIKNLAVDDIDDRIMEMMLLTPLTTPRHEHPIMLYDLVGHDFINSAMDTGTTSIDNTNNGFMEPTSPDTYIPRIIKGNLPGFFFDISTSTTSANEKTLQKVFRVQWTTKRSIHLEFYIEKPLEMLESKPYLLYVTSRPISTVSYQTQKLLLEQRFFISVVRQSTFYFRVDRLSGSTGGPTGMAVSFHLHYNPANAKYLYFSLTYGAGILYYTSETNVRAKLITTLSAFQADGNKETKSTEQEADLTIDQFFSYKQEQAKTIHLLVSLKPNSAISDNSVGLRMTRASRTNGVYPAHLISNAANLGAYAGCYLDGYKSGECLSYPLLSGPTDSNVGYISEGGVIKQIASGTEISSSCMVPYSDKICIIPKTGYIVRLEMTRPGPMTDNFMLLTTFVNLGSSDKDYYHQYTNDVNTKYLGTCLTSCKL